MVNFFHKQQKLFFTQQSHNVLLSQTAIVHKHLALQINTHSTHSMTLFLTGRGETITNILPRTSKVFITKYPLSTSCLMPTAGQR